MKAVIIINILLLMSLVDKTVSKAVENPGEIDLSQFGNQLFGSPDKTVGKSVKEWKNNKGSGNPEELGTYLEGDILFPTSKSRNGMVDKSYYWEDATVPYEVVGDFDDDEVAMIQDAMDTFHGNTCIKFVPKNNKHEDYISIRNTESGCWSSVGKVGGMQVVNLQKDGCLFKVGVSIHELLHALGFTHQQNSEDRDDYVKIVFQNIEDGKEHNFKKARRGTTSNFGVRYDYGSVMHYSGSCGKCHFGKKNPFSKKSKTNRSYNGELGQRDGFSEGDIKKVRSMYKCKWTTASTGYKNKISVTPMDTSGEFQDY